MERIAKSGVREEARRGYLKPGDSLGKKAREGRPG